MSMSGTGNPTEALDLLAAHPDAVPVAGSTDLGVVTNLAMYRPQMLVAIDRLPELRTPVGNGRAHRDRRRRHALRGGVLAGRSGAAARRALPQFASRLIRNAATFGGNLGTASPIGDGAPAPRPRRDPDAGQHGGDPRGRPLGLLHRLPPDRPPPG